MSPSLSLVVWVSRSDPNVAWGGGLSSAPSPSSPSSQSWSPGCSRGGCEAVRGSEMYFSKAKGLVLLIILPFWGNDEGSEPGNGFSAVQFGSPQHPPDPRSTSTPYPSPCSLHPASSTLYPSSFILPLPISHPPPFIPHPSPFIPPPFSCLLPTPPSPLISCPSPRSPHPPPFILCPSPCVPSFLCLQWDQLGRGSSKGHKTPGKRGLGGQRSRAGPGAGPNEAALTKQHPPPAMGLCPIGIQGRDPKAS